MVASSILCSLASSGLAAFGRKRRNRDTAQEQHKDAGDRRTTRLRDCSLRAAVGLRPRGASARGAGTPRRRGALRSAPGCAPSVCLWGRRGRAFDQLRISCAFVATNVATSSGDSSPTSESRTTLPTRVANAASYAARSLRRPSSPSRCSYGRPRARTRARHRSGGTSNTIAPAGRRTAHSPSSRWARRRSGPETDRLAKIMFLRGAKSEIKGRPTSCRLTQYKWESHERQAQSRRQIVVARRSTPR